MLVSLIERHIRHAGIHQGVQLGAKLAMRVLNEIDEVTPIYSPAGGRQEAAPARTPLAELDDTTQVYHTLGLAPLAPGRAQVWEPSSSTGCSQEW
jgi:hypothetical protein